jgi:hypothetical protein
MSALLPPGLSAWLAALARPLLRHGDYPRAEIDRAAKNAESQVAPAASRTGVDQRCARAIAVAQLRELLAEPAMRWVGNAWQCADCPTRVTLRYTDGDKRELVLPPSSRVSIAAGMILFPA